MSRRLAMEGFAEESDGSLEDVDFVEDRSKTFEVCFICG